MNAQEKAIRYQEEHIPELARAVSSPSPVGNYWV
jgi:hypothetical protein